MVPYKDRM